MEAAGKGEGGGADPADRTGTGVRRRSGFRRAWESGKVTALLRRERYLAGPGSSRTNRWGGGREGGQRRGDGSDTHTPASAEITQQGCYGWSRASWRLVSEKSVSKPGF